MRKMPKFQTDYFRKRMALYLHTVGQEIYEVYEKERKSEMKKLFISVPMKGRTDDNIRKSIHKMHRIAEAVWDENLTVIDSYNPEAAPLAVNKPVWYLGESIKKMADADYFIGADSYDNRYRGCNVERMVAIEYGIPCFFINTDRVAPDIANEDICFKESRVDE